MKTTFLLPVISQPRFQKRIDALIELGIDPLVLTFERDYFPGREPDFTYRSLGRVAHSAYHKRLFPYLSSLSMIRAAAANSDLLYAFGLDLLLLGYLARIFLPRQPKLVYEIGDIRQALLGDNLRARLLRRLERWLVGKVDLIVVTSEAYVTGYFAHVQGLRDLPYIVVENKLELDTFPQPAKEELDDVSLPLRIGYFGLLRCQRSWEILREVVRRGQGRFSLRLRGITMDLRGLKQEDGIQYDGPYVFPDDLPEMYHNVDMVWVAYPYVEGTIGNWHWARTNRFYEACYFRKPMLAQAGTRDGDVIEELNLGLALDLDNVESTIERIMSIKKQDIVTWQENLAKLPSDVYLYTDEHHDLMRAIQ